MLYFRERALAASLKQNVVAGVSLCALHFRERALAASLKPLARAQGGGSGRISASARSRPH